MRIEVNEKTNREVKKEKKNREEEISIFIIVFNSGVFRFWSMF